MTMAIMIMEKNTTMRTRNTRMTTTNMVMTSMTMEKVMIMTTLTKAKP